MALNKIWVFYNITMLLQVLKSNTSLTTTFIDCKTLLIELMKFSILSWKNMLLKKSMKKLNIINADGTLLLTTALLLMKVWITADPFYWMSTIPQFQDQSLSRLKFQMFPSLLLTLTTSTFMVRFSVLITMIELTVTCISKIISMDTHISITSSSLEVERTQLTTLLEDTSVSRRSHKKLKSPIRSLWLLTDSTPFSN